MSPPQSSVLRRTLATPSARVAAALAGLIAFAYGRVLIGGATWVERDALRFTRPSREFLVDALRAGRVPEWCDAVGFGAPFAANPVHELFAPLGWTMALLPAPLGFDLYNVLLLFVAALGTAVWARRLGAGALGAVVAGGTLVLGGYVASMVPNGWVPALSWIPWIGWSADRMAGAAAGRPRARAAALFAALLAFQLVAGEPAALIVALALAALVLWARAERLIPPLVALVAGVAGALLLAAVSVLPALALLPESARAAGLDRGGLEWSLHPARWVELIWPMVYGVQPGDGWYAGLLLRDDAADPCWSFQLFLGAPALIAAAAAWRRRALRRLLGGSLAFVVLALGSYTPLYPGLLRILPPLGAVNFPEKFAFGALLIWSIAAGVGVAALLERGGAPLLRRLAWATALLLGGAAVAVLAAREPLLELLVARAAERGLLVRPEVGIAAALSGASIAALATALFALACAPPRPLARLAPLLAAAALLGPSIWVTRNATTFAPRALVNDPPQLLQQLDRGAPASGQPRTRLFRVDPPGGTGPFADGATVARAYHESIDTNVAARFGLQVLPGFIPGESAHARYFGREIFPRMDKLAFVRLLGVEALAARDPELLQVPFEAVARGADGWALLSASGSRPRAFVTPRWREAADQREALASLAVEGRAADPAMVVVAAPAPPLPESGSAAAACEVLVSRPEQVRLDCASGAGGLAVLLEADAAGWSAEVDGVPMPLIRAEGLFRAVAVGAGPRTVIFRYRAPGLRAGALLSLVSWLGWALLLGWSLRRPAVVSPT